MKTYTSIMFFLFLFLFVGCSSTSEIVSENIKAESADLTPPNVDLIQTTPVILYKEEAYYPEMAQKSGIDGNVVLRAWITKTGVVRKIQIHRAETDLFDKSALAAGLKYKFEPIVKDGIAIDSWVEFTIQYRLNK